MNNKAIKKILKKIVTTDVPSDVSRVADEISADFRKSLKKTKLEILWESILEHNVAKYAIAAMLVVGVLFFVFNFDGSIDGASVAWANIAKRTASVHSFHFYNFEFKNGKIKHFSENWFLNSKVLTKNDDGEIYIDDGFVKTFFDDGEQIDIESSDLGNFKNIDDGLGVFVKLTQGVLLYESEEIAKQVPSDVGEDFLIYKFDPSKGMQNWAERVSITVGKNSLLPIQMKLYFKEQSNEYSLYIFDYDDCEMPENFIQIMKTLRGAKNNDF